MQNYVIFEKNAEDHISFSVPWPLEGYRGKSQKTSFKMSYTRECFCVTIEAACKTLPPESKRPQKGRVFEDDCLEIFIRPQSSPESFFPASFYYGWEVGFNGALLDYRAGIGDEGVRIIGSGNGNSVTDGSGALPGVEPVHGVLRDTICGTCISFDYDWKSKAVVSSKVIEKNIWQVELEIPWSDFGLEKPPVDEIWYFTVNRIDVSLQHGNPGLACLHEGITAPRFHQPSLFPSLNFA